MSSERMRLVIVGGVSSGTAAAVRARRQSGEAEIILLEPSNHVSFDKCSLPYHLGRPLAEVEDLYQQAMDQLRRCDRIDVRPQSQVTGVDRKQKILTIRDNLQDQEYELSYDRIILSPAALPVVPTVEGIHHRRVLSLSNVTDVQTVHQMLDDSPTQQVAVLGAGTMGLAITDTLVQRSVKVSLIEKERQVMPGVDPEIAAPLHRHLLSQHVDVHLNDTITSIQESKTGLDLHLYSGATLSCGLLILAAGVQPDIALGEATGLSIGSSGGLVVNNRMQTSDPNIYAIGNAIEVTDYVGGFETLHPLAGPAHQQGRIAAINAMGGDETYENTQGTAICKVFDWAVGITGLSEKNLIRERIPFEKIYIHTTNHAESCPGATILTLKLLFSLDDGTLFGAQCVGCEGVDKRIDVLATALRAGMSVFDLETLELAYAPPFGTVMDAVNCAGGAAADVLRGERLICHAAEVVNPKPHQILLDVRSLEEVEKGAIPGALHIPLGTLEQHWDTLPRDKELLIICRTGIACHWASCQLRKMGFVCRSLSGGYVTYQHTLQAGRAANAATTYV